MFKDGKADTQEEFRNAWGGSAFVWTCVYDEHLKDPHDKYDSWMACAGTGDRRLWDLASDARLQPFERAIHAFTFDRAMVRREHFAQLAQDLRDFHKRHLAKAAGKVCHLPEWADLIEGCEAEAVALYGTSVSDNLWWDYDEEIDMEVPYDLNERDEHFEVYDWLEAKMGAKTP